MPATPSTANWLCGDALHAAPINIRRWLTYDGLLSARMRELFGEQYSLRVVREQHVDNFAQALARMGCPDGAAVVREIEIMNGPQRMMFAQTCIPVPTLQRQPWLAQLASRSLGETLAGVAHVHRSALEFAHLSALDPLLLAALPAALPDTAVWARRSVFAVAGDPLLVSEVFLPELEEWRPY